jgi:diacylglycerol kinase (ATP)
MRTAAIARPRLEEGGFRVRDLVGRDADEAQDLAHGAVADGVDSLVVVGGDGLVHLAVQALAGTSTSLGIIPSGHGNDVARCLGLPRTDPQLAADVVVGSRTRRIDLGRCGTTYFVTVLAAGFDAAVNHRANAMRWGRGQLRYTVATIAELRVFKPLAYTLELDGRAHEVEAMLVAVGNGPTYGGGLRIAHGASLDDGWLDVVVVRRMSRLDLVRTYPKLFSGRHVSHPKYEHHRVRSVTVAGPEIHAYADGERVGALPVTIEVEPLSLEVLVP